MFLTYVRASGGKKCLFFGKFDLLCFFQTPVLRFRKNETDLYYPFHPLIFILEFLQGSKKMALLKKVVEGNQYCGNSDKISRKL